MLMMKFLENYWPTAGDKPTASKHDIEHSKWYKKVHKVVLSTTMKDTGLTGTPTATHSLIQLNLIDGYWLFVNPIILGIGIPLFVDIKDKIKLKLLTTRQFTCGVTALDYPVER
jgi:dihydrofolate reductase